MSWNMRTCEYLALRRLSCVFYKKGEIQAWMWTTIIFRLEVFCQRGHFFFLFLLEPRVSLRKPKNSMIINDSIFLVDRIYLTNGVYFLNIPVLKLPIVIAAYCPSFRVESVRWWRFYVPLLKVLKSWSGSSLLGPSLPHRVSGPMLIFACRPVVRSAFFYDFWKKAY